MIVAIMQPYFFPYVGYFQLMHSVDAFVFYDDVQYIKGGWINRNKIAAGDRVDWLTLPVKRASTFWPINERFFAIEPHIISTTKQRLTDSYAKARCFEQVAPTVFDLLDFPEANVAAFNCNSLTQIARRLGLDCRFVRSSELDPSSSFKGQDRVISICRRLGATAYINPIGGAELYDTAAFADAGIELSFLQTAATPVLIGSEPQHLSVIDGLMRSGFDAYGDTLPAYALVSKKVAEKHS